MAFVTLPEAARKLGKDWSVDRLLPAIADTVASGGALLCRPGDPVALAERLKAVLTDVDQPLSLAAAARRTRAMLSDWSLAGQHFATELAMTDAE